MYLQLQICFCFPQNIYLCLLSFFLDYTCQKLVNFINHFKELAVRFVDSTEFLDFTFINFCSYLISVLPLALNLVCCSFLLFLKLKAQLFSFQSFLFFNKCHSGSNFHLALSHNFLRRTFIVICFYVLLVPFFFLIET